MRYLLLPDGVGILLARTARPIGKSLTLSFSDIKRGRLLVGGEVLEVRDGRVNLPAHLLAVGENQLTLESAEASPAKWHLEGLRLKDGMLTPCGVDTTAMLLRLYEEHKQYKEAIAELRRSVLYFGSRIDGNCLF